MCYTNDTKKHIGEQIKFILGLCRKLHSPLYGSCISVTFGN